MLQVELVCCNCTCCEQWCPLWNYIRFITYERVFIFPNIYDRLSLIYQGEIRFPKSVMDDDRDILRMSYQMYRLFHKRKPRSLVEQTISQNMMEIGNCGGWVSVNFEVWPRVLGSSGQGARGAQFYVHYRSTSADMFVRDKKLQPVNQYIISILRFLWSLEAEHIKCLQ